MAKAFDPPITDNEHRVLRALATNSFSIGEGYGGATWSNCIDDAREPSGLSSRSLGGVVSSLVKKGWIVCDNIGGDATIDWASEEAAKAAFGLAPFSP